MIGREEAASEIMNRVFRYPKPFFRINFFEWKDIMRMER